MGKPRILIVDDETNVLAVMRNILKDEFEVFTTDNGKAGLEVFRTEQPDLVIADQKMEHMTGVEMLSRMRKLREDTIRIVLTAYGDFDAVVRAVNEGRVYRFVLKPWHPEDMLQTIRRALEHQAAQRSLAHYYDELKERNQELERTARELTEAQAALVRSEKLAAIGRAAGSVVHEIGNHLWVVSQVELLKRKHGDNEELTAFFDGVCALNESVQGMLDGYRFVQRHGVIPYRFEEHELGALLEETVALIRTAAYSHHRKLTSSLGEPVNLRMDRERMKQVFANLLRNACQATVPGGRVSIGYKVHELGVTVRVEDNGCGIRPEHAHVIWEPFFSTKGDTGLGLGLHICKTTVEAHQGAIECRSTPGGGSLFLVTLPRPACTPPNP